MTGICLISEPFSFFSTPFDVFATSWLGGASDLMTMMTLSVEVVPIQKTSQTAERKIDYTNDTRIYERRNPRKDIVRLNTHDPGSDRHREGPFIVTDMMDNGTTSQ